jgi:RNA polymerase sigma-70 factor, ECF subfamily
MPSAACFKSISVSGVKSRVQRGRQQLRELFMECCEIALDVRGDVVSCEPKPNKPLRDCDCTKKPL